MISDFLCAGCGCSIPPGTGGVVLVEGDECFDGCYVVVCDGCCEVEDWEMSA